MKKLLASAFLVLAALANTACSNQWRESDPGVEAEYAMSLFDEITGQGTPLTQNFNPAALTEASQESYATLYFAESGGAMGALGSIFSFGDTSFLGNLWGQNIPIGTNVFTLMNDYGLNKVSVVFHDGYSASGERYFTLGLKLEGNGSPAYFVAQSNQYDISSNEFATYMDLADGTQLILYSNDISRDVEGELAGTILLKAILVDQGVEYDIGQFSVLHGFGGQL